MTANLTALVEAAARAINAVPADDIPGLWYAPGYPELTTGQLLTIFRARSLPTAYPENRT